MSYCVNCGVELAPSEPACPLCGVQVVNPADPWKEPEVRPYPQYLETVMRGVDRRYFCAISALMLMVPVVVCLLVDLFTSGDIVWSGYVIGAAAIVIVTVLFPVGYGARRPFFCLGLDVVAALGYLAYIDKLANGSILWFFKLAMPVTLSFGLIIGLIFLYRARRKRKAVLATFALILFCGGAFTVLVELFVKLYLGAGLLPMWSGYAFVPCCLSGAAFLLLNSREKWKESVRKRLFF